MSDIRAVPVEIAAQEVKDLLDGGLPVRLVDVRESAEHAICSIEGASLIPMSSIPAHLEQLKAETNAPLIVFCHHGVRSLAAVEWLRAHGLPHCRSMAGGIDLWSREIDPAVPRY